MNSNYTLKQVEEKTVGKTLSCLKFMSMPKDLFDKRYATVHKQKHSLFPILFFFSVFNKSLDCDSVEKSSQKFPMAVLLLYADVLL